MDFMQKETKPVRVIYEDELKQYRRRQEAYDQLQEMASCHVAAEDYLQAERCYRRAAVLWPERPEPFVGLGVVAMQTGRTADALRAFQTARLMDARCAEAWAGTAMIYQERQKYPQAFEMYLRCLEIDSTNLMALLGLFQTSCQMGTFFKIIHYLEQYLETHPDDQAVLFCLASLYARDGQPIQAKQALLTVLANEPKKPEALALLREVEEQLRSDCPKEVA
ncbi:MAG: tetratricopeptide repeat protein [Phycisphaerae bacterium]|nr:tetratricopeptide repeat protein [Phycisphaerae bacterium]